MSLTQRNRMALDKLTSMSRLNTPSPSASSRASRSPLPALTSVSGASNEGSSSRLPSHSHSNSAPGGRHRSHTLSGSETERESQRGPSSASYSYSSDDQSVTPPSSVSRVYPSESIRRRRISLPESPSKPKRESHSRTSSPGPSQRTPRKRVSMAMSPADQDMDFAGDETHAITAAALAAVASLRRSPTSSGKKTRQPLPREFRETKKASSDGRASGEPTTPQKFRHNTLITRNSSPSPKTSSRLYNTSRVDLSPNRPSHASKSSTVREMTRKHQTRWVSDDIRSSTSGSITGDADDSFDSANSTGLGRRQTARGGSMESTLGARLVGDSLRAAGITMRKDGAGDVFESQEPSIKGHRRPRSSGAPSVGHADWEDKSVAQSQAGPSRAASSRLYDPRTPANATSHYRTERGVNSGPSIRPATSMAEYHTHDDMPPPRTAPSGLRSYKSTYAVDRDREGIGSSSRQQLYPMLQAPSLQERTYGSPRVRPRELGSNGKGKGLSATDEQAVEHLHLMDESLTMFETLLSRLPSMGETTTSTVPELFRNAQSVVRFSEQVNGMLRSGTNRALERLIDSEVADEAEVIDMVALWKDVGSDFRDCLRVSDELVRTMTGFLLGAGKVLRESAAVAGNGRTNGMANLQHLRGASEDLRRSAVDGHSSTSGTGTGSGKGSASGDGRRSTESRRSWEPRTEREKADLLRRVSSRADGILANNRSASSFLRDRDRDPPFRERSSQPSDQEMSPPPAPSPALRPLTSNAANSSSIRRLYAPRDREPSTPNNQATPPALATIQSQVSLHDYEPSPTPAPRPLAAGSNTERQRTLPPISIPAPLPSLPSESLLNRRGSVPDKSGSSRRKVSTASNITVRATSASFNIAPPSATTAVTPHTVSNSSSKANTPDRANFPLTRTDSASASDSSSKKNNVTFSRPLTVSVSALSGLQQRDSRSRTTSGATTDEEPMSATSPAVWTPRSGSETERPPRATLSRRTLGRARASLDATWEEEERTGSGGSSGVGTQAQTVVVAGRKERRRTITEIFS
ncbi:hypothetical protein BV25DRAFT_340956 [Artomyces pyxidatus]|uniref:Uncharacterized protein n=1 Tax=Artomyces pyxidatus TaxID=48021 RepID=A0ACB8T7I2_9AGAM|nr:hypothetical protein BV25DRAFT_340956 [Artomyces pyxidatus]